jgi:nucleotide-binding universal stress UspA family protein
VFQTIVIGTDGSPTARLAEDAALMLATAVGSELLVVSAYTGDGEAKAAAEMAVEETRRRADATGVYTRTAVAEGEPSAVLVDHADRDDADLIVVGDIGLGQRKRLRLGGIPGAGSSSRSRSRSTSSHRCLRRRLRPATSGAANPGEIRLGGLLRGPQHVCRKCAEMCPECHAL